MTTNTLVKKLQETYLDSEIEQKLPLIAEINRLKKEKNAVLLGHNYMTPDVFHGVSDIVGDSLYLSKAARDVVADILVFNGVHFMAETAKLLNPNKKVLIADVKAGCSLAESITRQDVKNLKQKFPGVPVVTYVNCSAEVKAETDICCTSGNALKIVESIPNDTIIFLPDEYLAKNIANQTKKNIIFHHGKCMVHELYTPMDLILAKKAFPELTIIAHPECAPDVVAEADFSGSTSQMMEFVKTTDKKEILLITECSMGDNMRSEFPEKHFVSSCQTCPHMKKITLEKILDCLQNETGEIFLEPEVMENGRKAVERMLEISFGGK